MREPESTAFFIPASSLSYLIRYPLYSIMREKRKMSRFRIHFPATCSLYHRAGNPLPASPSSLNSDRVYAFTLFFLSGSCKISVKCRADFPLILAAFFRKGHLDSRNFPSYLRYHLPTSIRIFFIFVSPGPHSIQHRLKAAAQLCKGVLHSGRNLRIYSAGQKAAFLHGTQLSCQHLL